MRIAAVSAVVVEVSDRLTQTVITVPLMASARLPHHYFLTKEGGLEHLFKHSSIEFRPAAGGAAEEAGCDVGCDVGCGCRKGVVQCARRFLGIQVSPGFPL